jgi:Holliday junction DNA helicase RuvA
MLARLEGTLTEIDTAAGYVRTDAGLTYEVLLPAFTLQRLAAATGQPVTLHTLEFLESQNQGAVFIPRLAGFLNIQDKAFYELFVTVKGIGYRRALRAMTLSSAQIATAIVDRDLATLQSLPEIGKRTAENLTVALRDKVERFTQPTTRETAAPAGPANAPQAAGAAAQSQAQVAEGEKNGSSEASGGDADAPQAGGPAPRTSIAREAAEAMVQLGENRSEAMQWIEQVLLQDNPPATTDDLLREVYRLKATTS